MRVFTRSIALSFILSGLVFLFTSPPVFAQASFSAKTDFAAGNGPQSVSIADLNGDGKPDLVSANYSSDNVSILLNTTARGASTPSFSAKTDFTAGNGPISVSVADLNGDGKPDMAVVKNLDDDVSVFFNTTAAGATTPSFSTKADFTTGMSPHSVSIGDLNGDGKPDVAVTNYVDNNVSVFFNTTAPGASTPSFSAKTDFWTGSQPYSVSIGDLNGDGKPDMAVANFTSDNVSILLNTTAPGASTPSFSAKTDFTTGNDPSFIALGDLNGDGKGDIVVTRPGSVAVLMNTTIPGASTSSFSSRTDFAGGPNSVFISDLNGDGKPDLATANVNFGSVSVFLNTTIPGALTPSFSAKTDFTTGNRPHSVSIADLNGDGKPDLASANSESDNVSILLNTATIGVSTPVFSTKTDLAGGTQPSSVSVGDLNGDGKPDLAVAKLGSTAVSALLNTTAPGASTPAFSAKTDFTTGGYSFSVSIADLNGDGKRDLAVANGNTTTVSVFMNTTAPGASTPSYSTKTDFTTGTAPYSVSIRDLNGDGKPDLAVANYSSGSISVLLNTTAPGASTPSFSAKTDFTAGTQPSSVSIGDLNGDGMPDLASANRASGNVSVLLNTTSPGASAASFSANTDFTTGTLAVSVSIGDLNGDGKLDLAVTNYGSSTVSVLLNTTTPGASTPTFSAKTDFTTGTSPNAVSIGDLSGDGIPDLAVANRGSTTASIFFNTTAPGASTPSFSAKTDFTTGTTPYSVSIADFNGDGRPDLASANYGSGTVSVLLNNLFLPSVPVDTISGNAISFDGINDYVNVGGQVDLNMTGPFTIEFWAQVSFTVSNEALVTKGDNAWRVSRFGSTDHIGFSTTGLSNVDIQGTTNVNDGLWHHVAAVYDGSSTKIYVDGNLDISFAVTGTLSTNSNNVFFGENEGATGRYLNGKLDEVRIWSVARTQAQIRENMHLTLAGSETGLTGYWQMNESSGITASDVFLTHPGTLVNGATFVTSTIPLGGGTSASQTVSGTGSVSFSGTSLGMNFTAKSGSDELVAAMISSSPGGTQPTGVSAFVPRYWTVEKFGSGTFTVNLTFTLPSGEISVTDQGTPANLKLFRRSGTSDGSWTQIASASSATATTVTFDGITTFSQFTIGSSSSPLPVQMSSFTATANGSVSELRWSTATETNNYGFEIERRAVSIQLSALSWSKVGFVEGHGTSNAPQVYSFGDKNVAPGRYAYRIKQIDGDGSSKYTGAVELEVGLAPREFTLSRNYPNPFNPSTSIEFTLPEDGKATMRIYDVLGREVATIFEGDVKAGYYQRATFEASRFASGIYIARLQHGGKQLLQKMILMK